MTEINQTSAKSNSLSTSNTNTTIKPEFDHKFKLMMLGNYNTLIIILFTFDLVIRNRHFGFKISSYS